MKSIKFFMAALLCLMVSTACLADDHIISSSQLPKAAKLYIQKNYKGKSIVYAEVDYEYGHKKYEVKLSNGVELKFDSRGNCYKVDYDDDYYRARTTSPRGKAHVRIHYDDDDDDFYDD